MEGGGLWEGGGGGVDTKQICSRWHSKIYFIFFFSEKIKLGISCERQP